VGTRIWQLIKESGNLRSVFDTMLAEYEVSEQRLTADLDALLTEIAGLGLITLEPGQ